LADDLEERVRHLESESDDVVGAASSTDSDLMEFSGTEGKRAKDGGLSHANVANAVSKAHDNTLDHNKNVSWPIGSVYLAVVSTNPATLLGFGTWAQIAVGQMLVGFKTGDADFGTIEKTGGAKTASHTNNHSGTAISDHPSVTNKQGTSAGNVVTGGTHNITQPTAHGDHNILNPFFVVYVWKRTV
jgi:hypothetical protein